MKTLLITIAALLLATGAAHAGPFYKWQCGEYTVTVQHKPPQQTSNDRSYGYIRLSHISQATMFTSNGI